MVSKISTALAAALVLASVGTASARPAFRRSRNRYPACQMPRRSQPQQADPLDALTATMQLRPHHTHGPTAGPAAWSQQDGSTLSNTDTRSEPEPIACSL